VTYHFVPLKESRREFHQTVMQMHYLRRAAATLSGARFAVAEQ